MKLISASNPRWANPEHTLLDLSADFEGIGQVPFTAAADDPEKHGRDIFAAAIAGDFGPIVAFPPKPLPQVKAEKLNELRQARETASVANVTVHGKTFSAETNIQTAFKRMANRMRRGKPSKLQAIMDVDGNPVTNVTQALLDGIEDTIADNTEDAWNKYVTLAAQVQAATTVEQVVAVTW